MTDPANVLQQLMDVIRQRRDEMPSGSYTTELFQGGAAKIGSKITEEAGEVVEAGTTGDDREHLIHEAADLIYHLLVMLAYRHVTVSDVEAKLASRFGISGLAEKAARAQTPDETS